MSHFANTKARPFRAAAALKGLLIPIVALTTFTGCGASIVAPVPVQPVAVVPEPVQELDTRIFYVFVREIQALTIYPDGGPIRNERRSGEAPPWGTNSEHFAIFSNWHGAEDEVAPAINAAVSLDDLLQRLAALPGVRIEEGVNPAYEGL